MPGKDKLEMLVEGGKASPDPNAAQKLSAYKLNIGDVFKQVNEKTAEYKGMQVPVKIIIDKDTKEVEIEVGMPPTSSLIKKELGIEKAKTPESIAVAESAKPVETVKDNKEGNKEETDKKEPDKKDPAKEEDEKNDESKSEEVDAPAEIDDTDEAPSEKTVLGSLTREQCLRVARIKMSQMLVKDLKGAVKQVIGTACSMNGIHVDGKPPKEALVEIDEGKWDQLFA